MARVANAKNVIANGAVSYIVNELQAGIKDFNEELNLESKFIGRGEELAKFIVSHLLDHEIIRIQVNIKALITPYDYNVLDPEIQKHNFDFVLWAKDRKPIVFEINYKHKEKAAKKWNNVFVPLLVTAGYDYVTINDYDCRKRGLFWLDTKKVHPCITWDDIRDVVDALEIAGITTMYS